MAAESLIDMAPCISHLRNTFLVSLMSVAGLSSAADDTWLPTPAGTNYSWIDTANWVSGTQFPNGIGQVANVNNNIVGNQTINLNQQITIGTLNLGDAAPTTAGGTNFSTFTIAGGTNGLLIFDVESGSATITRSVSSGVTDLISANVQLNDSLIINMPYAGNTLRMSGVVSGTGGISLITPTQPTGSASGAGLFLDLTNTNNSFAGPVELGNGVIAFRGSVLLNANSALGNSSSAIRIGTASSVSGTGTPNFQNNTTMELRLVASDDTSNHTIERGLDFSGTTGSAAAVGRARFSFYSDGAGGVNTNTLTISGTVTLASNGRGTEFLAQRQGQTIRFTGDILSGTGSAGTIFWGPNGPGTSTDGGNNGIYRFSDRQRTYTNSQNITAGTVIIEGNVGAAGTASPVGTQAFSFGDGNGGNIFSGGAGTNGPSRALFLETAGTGYARSIAPGAGGAYNLATASTTIQALYGNSGTANLMNGYHFGGLNTSGITTFSQNITPSLVNVYASGTAGGAGGTNAISVVHNIALSSATGGRTEFTGVISGSTAPTLGSTTTPGAAVQGNSTRITINQFRNHENLDTNLDGIKDTTANQLVGTATQGTVVFRGANTYSGGTEVLGGTLLANNTSGSATGTGAVVVAGNAALGGTGSITSTGVSLANLASTRPGDPLSNGGLGELTITAPFRMNATGGSILDFQISRTSDINAGSLSSNLNLDGTLNWTTILAATESTSLNNDKLIINGDVFSATTGTTTVLVSAAGTGTFAAGMAWNVFDWSGTNDSTAGSYSFNLTALLAELAANNLALDTSRFYDTGYLGVYVVPEPSRALLLIAALIVCLRTRRR